MHPWCAGRCWCSGRRRARPLCGCVAVWPHGCFGRRRPRPLCVSAGGGPPASRPRREPLARRVASKPGQAPPPPTGTAADPSGALHTSGAWCAEVWLGALSRDPARPCLRPRVPPPGPGPSAGLLVSQSFWGVRLRVVTNVVNRRCFSCGFLRCCYKRRQSDGFFAENQGFWTQIDDVCNMSTRKEVQSALV